MNMYLHQNPNKYVQRKGAKPSVYKNLTKTMNERAHTNKELNKIEQCKSFLKEHGAWDNEAIKEMES